jgi:hypothetical protein
MPDSTKTSEKRYLCRTSTGSLGKPIVPPEYPNAPPEQRSDVVVEEHPPRTPPTDKPGLLKSVDLAVGFRERSVASFPNSIGGHRSKGPRKHGKNSDSRLAAKCGDKTRVDF